MARFADCGVTFLDSPEDVIQLALAYLHRDPNSQKIEDLQAAESLVMAVRPYIRTFDSNRLLASIGVEGNLPGDSLVERLLRCTGPRARGRHRRAPGLRAAQGRLQHHLQCLADSGLGAAPGGRAQVSEFHSGARR